MNESFNSECINTKESLLKLAIENRKELEKQARGDVYHSAECYFTVLSLYDEFIDKIRNAVLFKKLEKDWEYVIGCNYEGIRLSIVHWDFSSTIELKDGKKAYFTDQDFKLFDVSAKYLTVEQYSNKYNISANTTRQWIRRGKLRLIKKVGNEWRISELCDFPKRGYINSQYITEEPLCSVPKDLSYLEGSSRICIKQSKDKKQYEVDLYKKGDFFPNRSLMLSTPEREKLELYLLSSNPYVKYIPTMQEGLFLNESVTKRHKKALER